MQRDNLPTVPAVMLIAALSGLLWLASFKAIQATIEILKPE